MTLLGRWLASMSSAASRSSEYRKRHRCSQGTLRLPWLPCINYEASSER